MTQSTASLWWVYLIRTRYNALYCGISNDVERRFALHQQGKGAKALRGKGPLTLEWQQSFLSKNLALKVEAHIKRQSKIKKEQLVRGALAVTIQDGSDTSQRQSESRVVLISFPNKK